MREITYSQNGEDQIPDISLEETRGNDREARIDEERVI